MPTSIRINEPDQLIPKMSKTLHYQACKDLAKRGRTGSFIYIPIWLILISTTALWDEMRTFSIIVFFTFAIAGVTRGYYSYRFETLFNKNPKNWYAVYFLAVISAATTWSIVTSITLWFYPLVWTSYLTSVTMTAIAAGGMTSLSTHRILQQIFMFSIFVPVLITCLIIGDLTALVLGVLLFVFLAFNIIIGKQLNSEYWSALRNNELLSERAIELEEARARAEELDKAKTVFLANMNHELRTPLNAILGFAHLLHKSTALTQKDEEHVGLINQSGQHLLELINNVLDLSKIEEGYMHAEEIPFSLDEVLSNVALMVKSSAQEKGLELLFRRNTDVPDNLLGDPLKLGQILINISNNAVKFSEQGEIVILVSANAQDTDSVVLQFAVRDKGIGMNLEQQSRLFQAFTQADSSITRKYGGTGLGLNISKQLAQLMGGDITVKSEINQGSEFIIQVKLKKDPKSNAQELKPSADIAGMQVLVVDDNQCAGEILDYYLESFGFKVTNVTSGEAAIKAVKESTEPFKLIIMDLFMPSMNGIEAAQQISHDLTIESQPKIILVSAFDVGEIRQPQQEKFLNNYLSKPVFPSTLFNTIMETFGHQVSNPTGGNKQPGNGDYLKKVRGAKILLVDDSEINLRVAREILESEKLIVDTANNGQEALDKLALNIYDCVLMDVRMPIMDGYTATRAIRQNEQWKNLPVIALTANALAEDRLLTEEAGMNDQVAKPINPDELFRTLAAWIELGECDVVEPDDTKAIVEAGQSAIALELKGINVNEGLKHINNNSNLYIDVLLSMAKNHKDAHTKLTTSLSENNVQEAIILAHTIKGVASTLGAPALSSVAADIEDTLNSKNVVNENQLDQFRHELDTVISSIETIKDDTPLQPVNPIIQLSREEITNLFSELEELIKKSNPVAQDKAVELHAALGHINFVADYLVTLISHLKQYDFTSASAAVQYAIQAFNEKMSNDQ